MYLLDDAGEPVNSEFSLDAEHGLTCIVIESSGGANPDTDTKRRNPDYNKLINLLLTRIAFTGAHITRVLLDSKRVQILPVETRIVELPKPYPIDVKNEVIDDLRKMIGRSISGMHQSEGTKSKGNAQKRIRIYLDCLIDSNDLIASNKSLEQSDLDRLENYAPLLTETERKTLQKARLGQGLFRHKLIKKYSSSCPLTGISHQDLLLASHIKPWKVCTNFERLDDENGILLSALLDRLFDSGLITFDSSGCVLASSKLSQGDIDKCGLKLLPKLQLTSLSNHYMEYHRSACFRE